MIIWDKDFSVGIKEIDEQHQKLFEIINRLDDSTNAPTNTEKISEIIKELLDYSVYHFSTEEKYFKEFNYEHTEAHIKSHNLYKEKVDQFIIDFKEKDGNLPFEIINFLSNWWTAHVNGQDKLYVKCFHEHGLY
ncbi:MAG: bacteriohemerythrin [Candidatus Daviesbacteria bacterium]|nr:bacteriohemerythrin [Candidatus Daviesbacteria bacterium]